MFYRSRGWLFILLLIWGCKEVAPKPGVGDKVAGNGYRNPTALIGVAELARRMEDYRLIDFRKREAYENGHIMGALQMWRTDIEDGSKPYRGIMAQKGELEELFSKKGIHSDDTLIIYDDNGGCDAARLWWVLYQYGFYNCRLLNGGMDAWVDAGKELTTDATQWPQGNFKLPIATNGRLLALKEEVAEMLLNGENKVLLDTRTYSEYMGVRQKMGATRAGRIPGSVHIDWALAVDYNDTKKFKPYEELEKIYAPLVLGKELVYAYCHTGVRSAHTTFVLTQLLGYDNVKNYDGSWVEWSYHNQLPVVLDSTTTIFN